MYLLELRIATSLNSLGAWGHVVLKGANPPGSRGRSGPAAWNEAGCQTGTRFRQGGSAPGGAPEAPFPAAIEDCEAAARWVASSPEALGRPATGIITIGDSAGGTATIAVSQLLAANPADAPVALQVPIFPLASDAMASDSLEEFAEGFVLTKAAIEYFDAAYQADRSDPRGFPILGDHASALPTVLVTASLDPIRNSGRDYGKALIEAGADVTFIEMKGVTHSFCNLRQAVPSTQGDLERVIAAMKSTLASA